MTITDEKYLFLPETEPLRQGDILYPVPRFVPINLSQSDYTYSPSGEKSYILSKPWKEIAGKDNVFSTRAVTTSWGIIISQDCDTRNEAVSCCPIETYDALRLLSSRKKMIKIREMQQMNQHRFHLPPNEKIGFSEDMYVEFDVIFQLHGNSLDISKGDLRKGRINNEIYLHFREKIANYFRRYAYDETATMTAEMKQECQNSRAEEEEKLRRKSLP